MNHHLVVTLNGQDRRLFMSFAMLNLLVRTIGSIEAVALVSLDPEMRSAVLEQLLSDRAPDGQITTKFNELASDLSVEDGEKIMDWVSENVLDFFIKGLETAKRLQDQNKDRLKTLMPSNTGSAPSVSPTPSAGPST